MTPVVPELFALPAPSFQTEQNRPSSMRRLLAVAASLTLIASPASAGIRDEYEQQNNSDEARRQRCEEIKAKATHFSAATPLGMDFYVVSGNDLVACIAAETLSEVIEYSLGETYRLSPDQEYEYHLENGELIEYIKWRSTGTIQRMTHIKRMP